MSSSVIISDDAKKQFWSVVRGCLRQFHQMTVETAWRKATQLRKKLERMPKGSLEFFYHSEPFDVACDIAHRPLNLEKYLERYLEIRDGKDGNGPLKQVLRKPSKSLPSGLGEK